MTSRDDEAIARQEANETFQSITDLDSIADTMVVGITFLLAALGTWTVFAVNRLASTSPLQSILFALVALCAVAIIGCMYFLTSSLIPRGFYGTALGDQFLNHNWQLWRNDDPGDIARFREKRANVASESDLEDMYEEWLDAYDPDTVVTSKQSFEFSRLLNYKLVARIKAQYTAYAVALLRIATVLFGVIILLSLFGPLVF